jgi:hypothetical protein
MWYLAEILFAEPQQVSHQEYQCESCNVVFDAPTAAVAYQKAIAWGQNHTAESITRMEFLGISYLTRIGDQLGDGVEICGQFFEGEDVWDCIDELIPPQTSLQALVWEQNQDKPLRELLTPEQIAQLKRVFG